MLSNQYKSSRRSSFGRTNSSHSNAGAREDRWAGTGSATSHSGEHCCRGVGLKRKESEGSVSPFEKNARMSDDLLWSSSSSSSSSLPVRVTVKSVNSPRLAPPSTLPPTGSRILNLLKKPFFFKKKERNESEHLSGRCENTPPPSPRYFSISPASLILV